ncbi:hypothetical protein [Streptomyces sp. NPDC088812]|uniref:hypothetical protein n=1 Tax=Streptomyces sp. NPDC088812 TaxID=3365905 RepID=UPI003826085E
MTPEPIEGYALADDPVIGAFEYAWCLTPEGRVADPAVPDGWSWPTGDCRSPTPSAAPRAAAATR